MQVEIEFFGPVQDQAGTNSMVLDLSADTASLDDVLAALSSALPDGAKIDTHLLRFARNDELIADRATIKLENGDRLALLSPFSGG